MTKVAAAAAAAAAAATAATTTTNQQHCTLHNISTICRNMLPHFSVKL